jgi:cobalt-zinc-cadmium efflux system membrane fusion protein
MNEDALATLETSRDLNSTLVILAPFDGVILEQLVEAGSRVEAADPIYRIASLDPLWMEVHVPLEQLGDTHIGQEVEIPELGVTGRIITIGHMVHGADQGVLIRAEGHEGSDKLRPGQFVQVQFAVTTSDIHFRIARSAVIYSKGNSFVFVEQLDGFAAYRVTVTDDEGSTLVIQADLPAAARVVVSGTVAIKAAWLEGVD